MGSRGVFQPVGQKRLTNIAVVRLKKTGIRFEIACYQNKVRDWRNGIEKDLDEVLQATTIYNNVSKGVVAKEKDLMAAFGTTDEKVICLEILQKGELQVSDKERKMEYDNLFRDVASVLSEKCVNPETNRPYTVTMLERALRDVHFNVDPKKAAKQQALEALPVLKAKFPIERARMRLRVTGPTDRKQDLLDMVDGYDAAVESVEIAGVSVSLVVQIEPGAFRDIHNRLQTELQGRARLEVLAMSVVADGVQADEFSNLRPTQPHAPVGLATPPPPIGAPEETGSAAASAGAAAGEASTASQGAGAAGSQVSQAAEASGRPSARGAAASAASSSPSAGGAGISGAGDVVYSRGPISQLPDAHASRKERFAELDTLQPGWEVELRNKGSTVEAVFFSPSGEMVGAFANARRAALAASKAALKG